MLRISAALLILLGLASAALAQTFTMPPPAGVAVIGCVYNLSPPTLLTATAGYMQCDSAGKLITSGSGTISGNVSNASSAVATTSTNIPTVAYNYIWNGATWDQAGGLIVGTAGTPSTQVVSVQGASGGLPVPVQFASTGGSYPTAATAIAGNATGTTGAVVGTLAAAAAKTTYLCDFDVSALGTASSIGPIVIAGLLGGSKIYQMGTLATGTQQLLSKNFNPCIPASAANVAITITTTADATATAVDVNSSGYQQ